MLLLHHGLRLCPTHHLWLATEPEFCVHHSALRKCTTIHTINRTQLMLFRALSDRIRLMDTCRKSKADRINKNYWTASKMWHTSTTETWKKKTKKKQSTKSASKEIRFYLCLKSVWCVTWSFNYARGTLPRGGKEINLDCGIINCKAIVPSTKPISYPIAVCSKALYKLKWVFFYLIIVFIYMNSKDIRKFCFISKQSHAFKFSCLSLNFSWLNQCRLFEAETRNRGSC